MLHGLEPPGPAVPCCDRGRHIFDAKVAQHPSLVQPPIHSHLIDAVFILLKHLVLRNDAVLLRIASPEKQRLVVNYLHTE